jgi:N-methylhydantoinase A/oxoprolinase/acetone carboxylase beta subunit/N-methylhydantoinase B/oxoprolinase/acetone carboxylase alpha subunit
MFKIGIDVGGTFTDFVVVQDGDTPRYFKTHSTPHDPSEGVITGLRDVAAAYALTPEALLGSTELLIHGTTVATNTLIERKGAKVGLLTTAGFRDLLEMREGMKEDRYNLRMTPVEPLVPRYLRLGVPERVRWNGAVSTALDEAAVEKLLDEFEREGVEALAVCLLFSYLNPHHEQRLAELIRTRFPHMYLSLSHEILPQIKEFDRLSTTVVNSYVGPVFGSYLRHLKERLTALAPLHDVLIMQSNGGVAPIDDAQRLAVQAILSGPAGGVNGAAFYGQQLGLSKVIGFDMGGTSTDISLVENGAPHLTTEQFEAGWKIAVPMIDMQTLGAGGGSIAQVDAGGILHVGPQSAGAVPGPACYGKGGTQPTVTDANVVLGYLDPERFLAGKARLDSRLAEQALNKHVAQPLGFSTIEAAYGVHQVVSTTMAEGIRLLSVKRGVDPREFALVAFGGASGLHVSRVARQLQIRQVYVPTAAPVLSAYGMLNTDLQYAFSRSYTASLAHVDLDAVRALSAELEAQGRARLYAQGVSDDAIEVMRSADMRYLDQAYEVNVPIPDLHQERDTLLQAWAENFHRRYQELYAYHQQAQEIRLVTLRVTVLGRLPRVTLPPQESTETPRLALQGQRRVYLGGWREVPVYATEHLSPGVEIPGPALLEAPFTTIVVEEGDIARVDPYGGIELQVALELLGKDDTDTTGLEQPDPITLAVVEHRLGSIALEMAEVMLRTSMSQILNSSRDFSTAILDADCQLIAQGEGIPVHISALPPAGEAVRDYFGEEIAEGDLFVLNDPYFGGSHLPDITIIAPIFYDDQLMFYAVNRAHHSDIGGATYGGYNPAASEIYHEGLRLPPLKLYDRGVPRHDLLHMLSINVRHPENFRGDLNAQIGSVMIAARRIHALLARYGPARLQRCVAEILTATERQVRQLIASWPDGIYKGETFIDDDGFDSTMVPIRATVTIHGESMSVDLSESSPQVTGFINSSYANTRSLAHAAIMYMAPADVPKNEGSMRAVSIIAPRGLIVNPNPPAPVCMSTNHCGEEIIEAIFKALAPAVPHVVSAGFSRRLRFAMQGHDPRTGRAFIWHFFHARGGGGASQGCDGWSNVGEVNVAGGIRSPSVELTEERFPFFIEHYEFRPDSGGNGTWRGGLGATFAMIYEGDEVALLNTAGDGVVNPPFGLCGGEAGLPHIYRLISQGQERVLRSKEVSVRVQPGDRIFCLSAGGGGFGAPEGRSVAQRDWDVRNGYTTNSGE